MQYDTNNLDEAAYLALQGYRFTVTRTGQISASFSFETDERFEEARARFWKGEASVQLHLRLATRTALKHKCAGQPLPVTHVSSPSIVPAEQRAQAVVRTGSRYWFYDGATIRSEMFGSKPQHASRLATGNFYPTRDDAEQKRNAMQDG